MKKSIHSEKQQKLCAFLRKTRTNRGLTQHDLAFRLEKPQSFVAKYEGGERRLDVIELQEIALILKIKPTDIFKVIT